MKAMSVIFSILALAAFAACSQATKKASLPALQTVAGVDLKRYAGTWYEIARYPNSFQRGCVATTATYAALLNDKIRVVNQCRMERLDGDVVTAEGKAWVVDTSSSAKLKVSFFWPFSGDYWIIDLGENYEFAVVGHPDRKYLWVLSRSPQMEAATYERILERLEKKHSYDTKRLGRTLQPPR